MRLPWLKFRKSNLVKALDLYNLVLQIQPEHQLAQEQRVAILLAQQQIEMLIQEHFDRLYETPENAETYQRLAFIQNQVNLVDDAITTLQLALEKFPENLSLKYSLVDLLFESRQWGIAFSALQKWLEKEPEEKYFKYKLIEIDIEWGNFEQAETALEALSKEHGTQPIYSLTLAQLRLEQNKPDEAIAILKDAIVRFPGLVKAYMMLSQDYSSVGKLKDARESAEKAFLLEPSGILVYARNQDQEVSDTHRQLIKRLAENHLLSVNYRAAAKFSLAEIYEKRGEYDTSFEMVIEANELLKPRLKYDYRIHRQKVAETLQYFSSELINRFAGTGRLDERLIFITGMPRSGTTLTEQILCSHPQVFGGGELSWIPRITQIMPRIFEGMEYPQAMTQITPAYLNDAAQYYLDRINVLDCLKPRFTDKLPHNFDHIGLIALMFPRAKIVHLHRDLRDVAVSNYYQNFGAAYGLMGYAFDLRDIGQQLRPHVTCGRPGRDEQPVPFSG